MTRQTYFIADLHLSENRPDITAAFFNFLHSHIAPQKVDALYILGDFFEVWVGDDYVSELSAAVAKQLKAVSNSGIPIYFVHGNRDFIMREKYANMAGMTLLDEQTVIDLYAKALTLYEHKADLRAALRVHYVLHGLVKRFFRS